VSSTENQISSIAERARQVAAGGAVVAIHFLRDVAGFVLGEEAIVFAAGEGEERRIAAHGGGILSAASDGKRIVTAGDDGKVVATTVAGETETLAADPKHRWVDRVALGPDGALAWSVGKQAFVKTARGERTLELPSSGGALAFAPKGVRLAIARYNGVTLWFPNVTGKPEELPWKGSHVDLTFSPDGKFLVTSMQEPTLHGWRVVDGKNMRMSGYATKVRSMSWSAGGKWLATSGADQLVMWPFAGKDGPMGKEPKLLAPSKSRVAVVACHPQHDIVAVGYEDGMILLVRVEDGAEILAKRPGPAPVTAMAWDAAGAQIAYGTEAGEAGIIAL
jgi:WD40 repeat protein